MKSFNLINHPKNLAWVTENLDLKDFKISDSLITVFYFSENQKSDILKALRS